MPGNGDPGKIESGAKRPCAKAGKKARANKKTAGAPPKPATTKAKKTRTKRKTNGQAAMDYSVKAPPLWGVFGYQWSWSDERVRNTPVCANNTATHCVSAREIPGQI